MGRNIFEFTNLTLNILLDASPAYIYWKDTHSIYQGCNKKLADFCGFKQPEDIIGKLDKDFNWGKELNEVFYKDDELVMSTGITKVSKHIIPHHNSDGISCDMIIKTEKSPLINSHGELFGIIGVAMDISDNLSEVFKHSNSSFLTNTNKISNSNFKFTKREYQILYLLYLGKSPKEIAWILSNIEERTVAPATITAIINKRIYLKLGVNSCSQIIEVLLKLNILHYIPKGFISQI